MLNRLVRTNEDYALTIARLVLGILFLIHGAQLMLGWFGRYGLSGSMKFFTQQLGIPAPFAFLAICAEFFGGLMWSQPTARRDDFVFLANDINRRRDIQKASVS